MTYQTRLSLFGLQGERKYLNETERLRFLECTNKLQLEKRLFCQLLFYTGARISEIHELSVRRFVFVDLVVVLRTLKRRRHDIYRQVPLPDDVLGPLLALFDYRQKLGVIPSGHEPFWFFSSRTASRVVKLVMTMAEINGIKASALGLRHSFAIHAVSKVPLTLVQKWMGHSRLSTTAIYLDISGIEERKWAEKMWE